MPFDPDSPSTDGSLFGLGHTRDEASVVVVPVPFDATCSYAAGSARAPDAIREASAQVDLHDRRFGPIWRRGLHMLSTDPDIAALSEQTRALAVPLIERGGAVPGDEATVAEIDAACARVESFVHDHAAAILAEGRTPAILGGEHSVSLGAIRACAETTPVGVLQIDAHMDLRDAYDGFQYSHASVMFNAMRLAGVERLVQVGIRDFCEGELAEAERLNAESPARVAVFYDADLADRLFDGQFWDEICSEIVESLPPRVYVTLDIDGLDPSLCAGTGTPVPGGLTFRHLSRLIQELANSDRTVVGFDLVEVAPGDGDWDANVGARVLYRLCALASHR